jgi:tripartite-type tricarboxylate transporter receptor subunit TctC
MQFSQILLAFALGSTALSGHAQSSATRDYPNRPIKMVIPYAAGGPMDFIGRTLGPRLNQAMGQPVVIDNRAGAGGAIGTDMVAKSVPDGYTLLNTSSSHASLPVVSASLPYDPLKDFTPITLVANSVGFVMAARPDLPVKNLKELLADAKANPGKYTFGSGGVGNVMHFAAEFLASSADVKMTHVPFKGVSQSLNDLVAGRIDFVIGAPTAVLPLIKAGKLKALAITARKRWSELPDVPTIDEAGVKGFVYTPWYGFWFPAGVPVEQVTRMRNEVVKLLDEPDIKKAFAEQGFATVGSTPAEFSKVIADEIAMNKKLAQRVDFTQ